MTPVELYVYDLSNGLSRTMSLPLTGKQIDGIWHTSVVVYGREIYYGQGILTTRPPGTTHHGLPLQRLAMGDTGLDEETIDEYLDGLRDHYRADKYHLLDFNCNSFTADVVGFLTGGTIPSWISSLPADFLSTPFGAALRPQIDAMFNPNAQPNPSTSTAAPRPLPIPVSPSLDPSITSSLLSQVAARASASAPSSANSTPPPPTTLSSPLQLATSSASLHAILRSSRAVVAFFTNPATCPPCRVVEPQFERLARERSRAGKARVSFVSVDLGVGRAGEIAAEWGITATPSFLFFLDGEKFDSLRGGDMRELESKLDMLLFQCFPPHKHSTLPLPVVQALSPSPICFTSAPAYPALLTKLISFIETNPKLTSAEMAESKAFFVKEVVPFLEKKPDAATAEALLPRWLERTRRLFEALHEGEVFPLIDLWRMGVLDPRISSLCAISSTTTTPVSLVLDLLLPPSAPSKEVTAIARPLLITSIRLLTNAFSSLPLATLLLSPATTPSFSSTTITSSPRDRLTRVLVDVLLASDASVRAAAAGLAFNVASLRHRRKSAYPPSEAPSEVVGVDGGDEEEGDWTLELVIAFVEAIRLEDKSEDVVYRLTSALALALHMSPYHSSTLGPNLEVLDARATLERKAAEAWVKKRETRVLLAEVGGRLCA